MQIASGCRHHVSRLTTLQGFEYFRRVTTQNDTQWLEQCRGFGDIEQRFSAVIQANDTTLVIHDNNGVLHVLENGFIGERTEFDNLLCKNQPGIDGQHGC